MPAFHGELYRKWMSSGRSYYPGEAFAYDKDKEEIVLLIIMTGMIRSSG
jgi:hypothetical protein